MVGKIGARAPRWIAAAAIAAALFSAGVASGQEERETRKVALHGNHWMAIAGKPLAATAGALTFSRGGNAVDATCAMLAAAATMWDTLSWGGETQALIFDPRSGQVRAINALKKVGVAAELVTIPGGGHGNFERDQVLRAWTAIEAFLVKHGVTPRDPLHANRR